MHLILLFLSCVLQNASFTFVSRARNSGSLGLHAIASVFSNGIWFLNIGIIISNLSLASGIVYVAGTVSGSVGMHWFMMKYIEKGKRKVGAA